MLGLQQQPLDCLHSSLQASWPVAEGVCLHESFPRSWKACSALAGRQPSAQHLPDNVEAHAGLRLPCRRCTVATEPLLYIWFRFWKGCSVKSSCRVACCGGLRLQEIHPCAGQAARMPAGSQEERDGYDADRSGRQAGSQRPLRPRRESSGSVPNRTGTAVLLFAGRALQLLPPLLPLLLLRCLLCLHSILNFHACYFII